jgi:hypothetical protein
MIKRRPFLKLKLQPPSFPNKEISQFDDDISIPASNNANLVFIDIPCTQDYKLHGVKGKSNEKIKKRKLKLDVGFNTNIVYAIKDFSKGVENIEKMKIDMQEQIIT